MNDFHQFLRGLRADPRLGRHIPDTPNLTPETVVLALCTALAEASEGRQTHGGHALLRRLSDAEDGATYTQPPATAPRATAPRNVGSRRRVARHEGEGWVKSLTRPFVAPSDRPSHARGMKTKFLRKGRTKWVNARV